MTAPSIGDWATVSFRKSSRSSTNGGQCVEVGAQHGVVAIKDSKCPNVGLVEFPATAWAWFLSRLRA